jgi:hypothetical protein
MKLLTLLVCAALAQAAAPRPHPRVEMTPEVLSQLQALRRQNDPVWTRLARWIETHRQNSGNKWAK